MARSSAAAMHLERRICGQISSFCFLYLAPKFDGNKHGNLEGKSNGNGNGGGNLQGNMDGKTDGGKGNGNIGGKKH